MSHPQLDELRLMTPRSRILWVAQWAGVNRLDWEELLGMGEAAMTKMEEANGGDPAARMERLEAIKHVVAGYAGLALTFGVLDFSSEEHKMWCDRVLDLIRQPLGGGTQPTHPQRSRFEEHYASLVGGNRVAEGWLREMVSNVKGRLEMLADCLESASGAPS